MHKTSLTRPLAALSTWAESANLEREERTPLLQIVVFHLKRGWGEAIRAPTLFRLRHSDMKHTPIRHCLPTLNAATRNGRSS